MKPAGKEMFTSKCLYHSIFMIQIEHSKEIRVFVKNICTTLQTFETKSSRCVDSVSNPMCWSIRGKFMPFKAFVIFFPNTRQALFGIGQKVNSNYHIWQNRRKVCVCSTSWRVLPKTLYKVFEQLIHCFQFYLF